VVVGCLAGLVGSQADGLVGCLCALLMQAAEGNRRAQDQVRPARRGVGAGWGRGIRLSVGCLCALLVAAVETTGGHKTR
jgi:hypothetical protein